MTAKRYHKLFLAEMSKLMAGNPKAGMVLKSCRTATPKWDTVPGRSYQGAWNKLRPMFVSMPYNTEADVPRK